MKWRKDQFDKTTAPSFSVTNMRCNFCQSSIKENEEFYSNRRNGEYLGICSNCFEELN